MTITTWLGRSVVYLPCLSQCVLFFPHVLSMPSFRERTSWHKLIEQERALVSLLDDENVESALYSIRDIQTNKKIITFVTHRCTVSSGQQDDHK